MHRRAVVMVLAIAVASAALLAFTNTGARLVGFRSHAAAAPAAGASQAGDVHGTTPGEDADATPRAPIALDTRRQQLVGVRTVAVERRQAMAQVHAPAAITYDERRQIEINTKLDGWVRDLRANYTGVRVRRGDPLFTLYSPELLAAQHEYLLALRSDPHPPSSPTPDSGASAGRLAQSVRARLTAWDVSAADIDALERGAAPLGTMVVRAPAAGVVIEKSVIEGMRVAAGQRLFVVADVSTLWVEAAVSEKDLAAVHIGQQATVTVAAYPGEEFRARTTYLDQSLAGPTRTLKVRLELANPGGRLKPGMYGDVTIAGDASAALMVPADAVLDSGTEQVVFVARGNGYFDPRPVRVARRHGDMVEIAGGVAEGERVASAATFFLDSESQMRGALGNYEARNPATPERRDGGSTAPEIAFRAVPDPPRMGESTLEVVLTGPGGGPVTDAEVSVRLSMPAMPSMNMPAMRSDARLIHAGGGRYTGAAQVAMAGRWDVEVTVTRQGQAIGRRQFGLVAR